MDEIRLKIFGPRDLSVFLIDLLCDGDSVYTRENLYENLGTPVKTCLICMGTPVKTVGILAVVIILSPISSTCGELLIFEKESYMSAKELCISGKEP